MAERDPKPCSKCAAPNPDNATNRYCKKCRAERERNRYKASPRRSPVAKARHQAFSHARVYLSRGKISKDPCACGSDDVLMQIPDLTKPTEVTWICRPCQRRQMFANVPDLPPATDAKK